MHKKYIVRLSPDERTDLITLISAGKGAARALTHARILLKADQGVDGPGWIDEVIAEALEVSLSTVERVRRRWVTEGQHLALYPRPAYVRRGRLLDGSQEAHVIALACSAPPAGRVDWTLRLLAHRIVELDIVPHISPETVRQTLKKTRLSPG